MKKLLLLIAACVLAFGQTTRINGNRTITGTLNTEISNAASTGTTVNKLAILTGAPSTVVIATTATTSGVIGIVSGGAGTSGIATVATWGVASCAFDGATTANDYVQVSTTVSGDCHDAGATQPTSGQVIGYVTSTNASAGTYSVQLSIGSGSGTGAGGTQSVKIDGTIVDSAMTVPEFITGFGITPAVTNVGTGHDTIQHSVDTTVVLTRAQDVSGLDKACHPSSGSASTYVCSTTFTWPAYTDQQPLAFKPDVNCSASPTINVNTLGARSLYEYDGTAAKTSDCTAGLHLLLQYDSALSSGVGGWRIMSAAGGIIVGGPAVSCAITAPSTTCTFSGAPAHAMITFEDATHHMSPVAYKDVSNADTTSPVITTDGTLTGTFWANGTGATGATGSTGAAGASGITGITLNKLQKGISSTAVGDSSISDNGTAITTPETINGVSPATMAFLDPTSSVQTQLNSTEKSANKDANSGYAGLDSSSKLKLAEFPATIASNTTGNASSATALAANPTNCSAGNSHLGVDASGNAETCFRVPQQFFGTAAPGSVTGNLPGDRFSDTTNHNDYWCNATSGTAAPACTTVASGAWTLANGGAGGGGQLGNCTATLSSGTVTFPSAATPCNIYSITLTGSVTASSPSTNPISMLTGQYYTFVITQNATGGFTWPGSAWPTAFVNVPSQIVPDKNQTTSFSCLWNGSACINGVTTTTSPYGLGTGVTFATLTTGTSCGSSLTFGYADVTDSTTSVLGATIVGGGSNKVGAFCNGTNWIVSAGTLPAIPTVTGGTCTNQVVTGISTSAVPTCGNLPNGITATTQSANDNSGKPATTAYVDGSNFTKTIASGTASLGTTAVGSGACSSVITVSATGVATTDVIVVNANGDPTAVTGYTPATTGSLYVWAYPTTNNVNFKLCNNTSASITPGSAVTLNWRVPR